MPAQLPSRLSSDCNGKLAECHKIKIVKIEYFFLDIREYNDVGDKLPPKKKLLKESLELLTLISYNEKKRQRENYFCGSAGRAEGANRDISEPLALLK